MATHSATQTGKTDSCPYKKINNLATNYTSILKSKKFAPWLVKVEGTNTGKPALRLEESFCHCRVIIFDRLQMNRPGARSTLGNEFIRAVVVVLVVLPIPS